MMARPSSRVTLDLNDGCGLFEATVVQVADAYHSGHGEHLTIVVLEDAERLRVQLTLDELAAAMQRATRKDRH